VPPARLAYKFAMNTNTLSSRAVLLLAIAGAIVTANAYYVHPIIGRIATEFGVNEAMVGAVPAFNQIALALGIFLILPLGDRISNRRLVMYCLSAQVVALGIMAVATDFWFFTFGSTLLGFFTITPYLLPAYASKRVEPERLGHVTSLLAVGVMVGILLSRTGAGVVAEFMGWRTVYWIAFVLMIGAAIGLPILLEERDPSDQKPAQDVPSYGKLIGSLIPLAMKYPQTIVSGTIQGVNFGIFLVVWLGIGLYLTSPEIGLGTDIVGYFAAFTALNTMTTPRLGKLADKIGPRRTRFYMSIGQLLSMSAMFLATQNYWLVMITIMVTSVVGPMIDITGRMTCLNQPGDIRTRLMTIYITIMFLIGGACSWVGTTAYHYAGWFGICCAGLSMAVIVVGLSAHQAWRQKAEEAQSS